VRLETRWSAFLLALYIVFVSGFSAKPPKVQAVTIAIEHGTVLPHEGTARLRVTVEPNTVNRGLWTAIESEDYASAHYEQIDGASSARTRWVEFPDLPDGSYTAEARLLKDHGEQSARVTFSVGFPEEAFP